MITSEEELKTLLPKSNKKEVLQPKFRRMIDRVLVNDDPAQREAAAQRLSEILAKIMTAFADKGEKDDLVKNFYNKEGFNENLEKMLLQCRRFNIPVVLIFADVDHFKEFNDTQGHQRGDDKLAAEGECITNSIRAIDFASRYGGDEFAVCVVGADLDGGEIVAKRIAATSKKRMPEVFPDYPHAQTLSIGVTESMSGDTVSSLIDRADQAMYQAKRGKDRIVSVRQNPQSGKLDFKTVTATSF